MPSADFIVFPGPQVFELCESLNAVGAVLDLHKLLENRKASPESKMAVLEALGEISKVTGALKLPSGCSLHVISCSSSDSSWGVWFSSRVTLCPCLIIFCQERIGHGGGWQR